MGIERSKGRIVEVYRETHNTGVICQGDNARGCVDGYGYSGGNGSYRMWDKIEYRIMMKVYVYAVEDCAFFDIRDEILEANNRSRVSPQLFDAIKNNLEGEKISLFRYTDGDWSWRISDWDELDLEVY